MELLELQKSNIINDYNFISLIKLAKKYNCSRFLMKKFLIKNNILIKNYKSIAHQILKDNVKKCSKCKSILHLSNFSIQKSAICGYRSTCKKCRAILEADYNKIWIKNNKESKAKIDKTYREKNIEKIKLYKKSDKYKQIKALSDKKYYEKIKKDPKKLLNAKVKSAMSTSIKFLKNNHYFEILGYNVEDLKNRLENTFLIGMSWNNYGINGWHIDHIKPLVLFDLTKESEFIKSWELSNLQALWASENCSKGSFYENKRHFKSG